MVFELIDIISNELLRYGEVTKVNEPFPNITVRAIKYQNDTYILGMKNGKVNLLYINEKGDV